MHVPAAKLRHAMCRVSCPERPEIHPAAAKNSDLQLGLGLPLYSKRDSTKPNCRTSAGSTTPLLRSTCAQHGSGVALQSSKTD